MKILSVIVSATVIVVSSLTMHAKIELPSVFSDNMVVQQNAKLTVAGKAKPLSTVTFRSDWEGGECKAKADKEGRFVMKVPTPPAGGPIPSSLMMAPERRKYCRMSCRERCGFAPDSRIWNFP